MACAAVFGRKCFTASSSYTAIAARKSSATVREHALMQLLTLSPYKLVANIPAVVWRLYCLVIIKLDILISLSTRLLEDSFRYFSHDCMPANSIEVLNPLLMNRSSSFQIQRDQFSCYPRRRPLSTTLLPTSKVRRGFAQLKRSALFPIAGTAPLRGKYLSNTLAVTFTIGGSSISSCPLLLLT